MPELPEVVRAACETNKWPVMGDAIDVPVEGGRRQMVSVDVFEEDTEKVLRLHTVIGDADALTHVRMESALSMNFTMAHGAIALHQGQVVIVETFLLDDVDELEVSVSVRYIAETADRFEKGMFGTDEH